MKTLSQFLNESGGGDCLDTAGRAVAFFGMREDGQTRLQEALRKDGATAKSVRLVHALVNGQGGVSGKRFVHAWVENRNKVFDYSNGNSVSIDKDTYYALGGIKPDQKGEYKVYTQSQTIKQISKAHHWGPWQIDLSKEILENAEVLDEARKVLPTTKAQIGKHKVKISKDDAKDLKDFF